MIDCGPTRLRYPAVCFGWKYPLVARHDIVPRLDPDHFFECAERATARNATETATDGPAPHSQWRTVSISATMIATMIAIVPRKLRRTDSLHSLAHPSAAERSAAVRARQPQCSPAVATVQCGFSSPRRPSPCARLRWPASAGPPSCNTHPIPRLPSTAPRRPGLADLKPNRKGTSAASESSDTQL